MSWRWWVPGDGPLAVTLSSIRGPHRPQPDPRWSAAELEGWWRAALARETTVRLVDDGGLPLVATDPDRLVDVPAGAVALVDWPDDSSVPANAAWLSRVVTLSDAGAQRLAAAGVRASTVVLPPEPTPAAAGSDDVISFSGWSWDSNAGQDGSDTIVLAPDTRLFTVIADADDADRCWSDTMFAFTEVCRDRSDCTLLVWRSHKDITAGPGITRDVVTRGAPHSCRVVVALGQLPAPGFTALVNRTDVFIAGNDPPAGRRALQRFLATGVPVLADPAAYPEFRITDMWIPITGYTEIVASDLTTEPQLTRLRNMYEWGSLAEGILHAARTAPKATPRSKPKLCADDTVAGLIDLLREAR